jgi:CO dehydrogenase/acetyl-CoA synthase gamma subunit (corrinoid Fe-S protein)
MDVKRGVDRLQIDKQSHAVPSVQYGGENKKIKNGGGAILYNWALCYVSVSTIIVINVNDITVDLLSVEIFTLLTLTNISSLVF